MKLDYTTRARGIAYKYPLLSDIAIQINFWIIAYVLFFVILYFISKAITSLYPQEVEVYLGENIVVALIAAIPFGAFLGIIDFFVEKRLRGRSLGIEILIKGVLYLAAWYLVGLIAYTIGTAMEARFVDSPVLKYTELFSGNVFYATSIYTAVMIIIISFIKQVNIGTPTMGGWLFVIPVLLITGVLNLVSITSELTVLGRSVLLPMAVMLAFALLGSVDDWMGVRGGRRGEGLKGRWKFLAQTVLALGAAIALYDAKAVAAIKPANPSRPSVRLTALVVATITKVAIGT